tara:strand:- start:4521 stop:4712 length:192 start_codon:yes stop_codon:yes gene_type:complete
MKIELEYKHLNFIKTLLVEKHNEAEIKLKDVMTDSKTPLTEIDRLIKKKNEILKVQQMLQQYN